jgi:hypothetical protein
MLSAFDCVCVCVWVCLCPCVYVRLLMVLAPACADVGVMEGPSAHLFCLYGTLVDSLACGDRTVVESIQRLLRRLGDELAFVPAAADGDAL